MGWDYRVTEVIRVVDGDTLDLRLDLGFHLSAAMRFRLLGVDTPERGQPGWAEATAYVQAWCDEHSGNLRVRTHKADSFGRWLADLYWWDSANGARSLSAALLLSGHGEPYSR